MTSLRRFTVTVRVYDPDGEGEPADYALPVDSPDAEHAVSAAMSNAVAFTPKLDEATPRAVAFRCIDVTTREGDEA